MMSNDLLRLVSWMLELDARDRAEEEGDRIFNFRLQASAFYEASTFIREAIPRWPQVRAFVAALPDSAQQELARVQDATNPKAGSYLGDWIEDHRNVTFHYSEMHPDKAAAGKEEIGNALREAADIRSHIQVGQNIGAVRFEFADQVAVQWLPDGDDAPAILETLRERVMDLVRFTQQALQAYLSSLDEDRRPTFELV